MPNGPVAALDPDFGEEQHKILVSRRHKVMQHSDAGAAADSLDLTDCRRDFHRRAPTLQYVRRIVELRRVDQILDVADEIMKLQFGNSWRLPTPLEIGSRCVEAKRVIGQPPDA